MRIRSSAQAAAYADGTASAVDPLDNRIGAIMVRDGHLTVAQVDDILDRQAETGTPFGETAIAMGLVSLETVDAALARQGGTQIFATGDERVDPLLVAAFDMESPYVVAARAIRSSIVRSYAEDDGRRTRFCALIGLDCDEELAVMAANLGTVMARMQTPTLLIDGNRGYPRLHELLRVTNQTTVQGTAIPDLWLVGAGDAGAGAQAPFEREPIVEKSRDWNVPAAQVLAAMMTNSNSSASSIAAAIGGFDTAVILTRKHVTPLKAARNLIETLDEHGIPITGTVMV